MELSVAGVVPSQGCCQTDLHEVHTKLQYHWQAVGCGWFISRMRSGHLVDVLTYLYPSGDMTLRPCSGPKCSARLGSSCSPAPQAPTLPPPLSSSYGEGAEERVRKGEFQSSQCRSSVPATIPSIHAYISGCPWLEAKDRTLFSL